jgi:class 3 adenylate cyclase/tetratricopeptide (TPR) repeat protein
VAEGASRVEPAPDDALLRHVPDELAAKIRRAGAVAGERKRATVLFCDLVGSTAIAEHLDPESYRELLDEYLEVCFENVYRYEGIVNQMAGDGFMALFGAPIAHEDAPERSVHAALGILGAVKELSERRQRKGGSELRVRIGVHTGTVVVGTIGNDLKTDYTAIGDTTNLAARLQALANPNAILLSEDTHALIRDHFVTKSIGAHEVKGKTDPVTAYEVLESSDATPMAIAEARGMTPLVGRDPELAQLAACFRRLDDRLAQLVTIVGEAGSGKSRLTYEAMRRLWREGTQVLEGRCASLTRGVPYAPWAAMLRGFFGVSESDDASEQYIASRLGGLGCDNADEFARRISAMPGLFHRGERSASFGRETLFPSVAEFVQLAARSGPTLLLIEDLHWADAASVELLEMVIASCLRERVMFIVTHRPDFNLDAQSSVAFTRLHMRLLTDDEACEIVRSRAGGSLPAALEERILRRGEGNPFYLEELTRALLEEGALVAQEGGVRVTRPIESIRIPDTVQELLSARLDRLGPESKRVAQVASVIGRQFKRSQLESLLADGDRGANRIDEELAELEQSGVLHRQGMSSDEFRFGESLTQEVAYEGLLLRERRLLHERVGRMLEEHTAVGGDLALVGYHFARSDKRDVGLAKLLEAANRAAELPSYGDAIRLYREALDLADTVIAETADPNETAERSALRAIRGILGAADIYGDVHLEEKERALRQGLVLAEKLEDHEAFASIHVAQGTTIINNSRDGFAEGIASIEQGIEAARRAGLERTVAQLSRSLSWAYLKDGRFEEARACIAGVLTELERLGERERVSDTYLGARFFQNRVLFESDAFEEALERAHETYELGTKHQNRTVESGAATQLASLYFRQGEYEEAERFASRGLEIAKQIDNVWAILSCAAVLQGIRHDRDPASVDVSELEAIERGTRSTGDASMSIDLIAEVLIRIGDVERARRIVETGADRAGGRLNESRNELCLGYVALNSGKDRFSEAKRHFRRSRELAESIGSRSIAGRALLGLALLTRAQGDDAYRGFAQQALNLFQSLGLRRYAARAESMLG